MLANPHNPGLRQKAPVRPQRLQCWDPLDLLGSGIRWFWWIFGRIFGTPQHGAFEFCTTVLNTTDQDTSIMGWMCGRPLWSAGPVSTSIMWSQIPWVTSCTTPPTQSSKSPATHEYIRNTAYAGCKHQIPMHTALVTKRVKPKATTQGMFALGWYRMMPW